MSFPNYGIFKTSDLDKRGSTANSWENDRRGKMNYLYILGAVVCTVWGQLIIKWQVNNAGSFPTNSAERVWFLLRLILNPWVLSSLAAAFLAFLFWVCAITKFELSHAYPFMSLSFVLVLVLSGMFFGESITLSKIIGVILVIGGIIVGSRG
jgi:multidrug transporter EmrE-like cation transporter